MATSRNRIVSAALLLPVILFSAVWTSFNLWRCQSDGLARARCCCPGETVAADGTAPAAPRLTRPACCDLERHAVERAPAETSRSQPGHLATAGLAAMAAIPVAVLPVRPPPVLSPATPPLADDGPASGRTLVLQKQSFLI